MAEIEPPVCPQPAVAVSLHPSRSRFAGWVKSGVAPALGIGLVAALTLGACGKKNADTTATTSTTTTRTDSVKSAPAAAPATTGTDTAQAATVHSSDIGVTRKAITDALGAPFTFKKDEGTASGHENYMGISNDKTHCSVMLEGPAENLVSATFNLTTGANDEENHTAGMHLGRFIQAIDPTASDWVVAQLGKKEQMVKVFGSRTFTYSTLDADSKTPIYNLDVTPVK